MGVTARAVCGRAALVAALALAVAATVARAQGPRLAGEGATARIAWPAWRDSSSSPPAAGAEVAAWTARLGEPTTAATALHVLGELRLAAGDTTAADSCWRALAARPGVWQWDALQHRADVALARAGAAAADTVLAPVEREGWSESERAAWLAARVRLRAAAGDGAQAAEFARQLLHVYPGSGGPAVSAFALLDSLARAHGDSLDVDDLRLGVDVDALRAARAGAIGKQRRVLARTSGAARFVPALRLVELLRAARMPLAALAAADAANAYAVDPQERSRALLERARAWRDAARTDSALAAYARVARQAPDGALRARAWWELAREAEDRCRYRDALAGFTRLTQLGDRRSDEARFRAGLAQYALGNPDSARSWWRGARGENARFWLGVSLRGSDRAAADSVLGALAVLPGYGFYRAAARETLGVRGWPARAVADASAEETLPIASDVRALLASGRPSDAGVLLSRWAADDPRAGAVHAPEAGVILAGAALALESGRTALSTRLAERAFGMAMADSAAWAIVAWAYPPAFEREVVAAECPEVERALLWALVRQESRFDPRARSRSDALGLTQLKLATAGDVARALHEGAPTEATLFAPRAALRYGAGYLAQLVRRFGGCVPVALAAYNAGASTIRADWRTLVARGGEALYAEYASNSDSQDYVRRIVGFRQAYRELRPTTAP